MRILYLMHVDWGWAKQRPHYLAEGLAAHGLHVTVLYKPTLHRQRLVANHSTVRRAPLIGATVSERFDWGFFARLQQAQVALWAQPCPDVTWLSWPNLIESVPHSLLGRTRLVYDCMDLSDAFPGETRWRQRLVNNERRLLAHRPLVLASSQAIADHVSQLDASLTIRVIPNAYDPTLRWQVDQPPPQSPRVLRVGYFGTIAEWFAFDEVIQVLEAIPVAQLVLIGPCRVPIPNHPRIKWLGPKPHDSLPALTANIDVFIMPFQVTRLIAAVDPVKLYEYIASQRPVVARRYPTIERFAPHVSLYDSPQELIRLLEAVMAGEHSIDPVGRRRFLEGNSWSGRTDEVVDCLTSNHR